MRGNICDDLGHKKIGRQMASFSSFFKLYTDKFNYFFLDKIMFKNGVGVLVISKIIKLIGLGVNKSYIRMDPGYINIPSTIQNTRVHFKYWVQNLFYRTVFCTIFCTWVDHAELDFSDKSLISLEPDMSRLWSMKNITR